MSDYRDPMYGYEPADRTGIWGWLTGCAVFLVVILGLGLGLALGVGHEPTRVASNNATPPQTTAPAVPSLTPPPSQAPNRP
jgi:hypothetical protein